MNEFKKKNNFLFKKNNHKKYLYLNIILSINKLFSKKLKIHLFIMIFNTILITVIRI